MGMPALSVVRVLLVAVLCLSLIARPSDSQPVPVILSPLPTNGVDTDHYLYALNTVPLELSLQFTEQSSSVVLYAVLSCGSERTETYSWNVTAPPAHTVALARTVTIPSGYASWCRGDTLAIRLSLNSSMPPAYTASTMVQLLTPDVSRAAVAMATLSLVVSLAAVALYWSYRSLQAFPSPLIINRTAADILLAMGLLALHSRILLVRAPETSAALCGPLTGASTQFGLSAGLIWSICTVYSLYLSSSNPFIRPANLLHRYHVIAWSFGAVSAAAGLVLGFVYRPALQTCFFPLTQGLDAPVWLFFFAEGFCGALFGIYASVVMQCRLHDPASLSSLESRKQALKQMFFYVTVLTLFAVLWLGLWATQAPAHGYVSYAWVVLFAGRAVVDAGAWAVWHGDAASHLLRTTSKISAADPVRVPVQELSEALRYGFIQATAHGVARVLQHPAGHGDDIEAHDNGLQTPLLSTFDLRPELGQSSHFAALAPDQFARLRHMFQVSDESFVSALSGDPQVMKQNFTEGASGSFFYFSVDKRFLVKTVTADEAAVLTRMLDHYVLHFQSHPGSLLCRFYGLYELRLHGVLVRFVVMNNWLHLSSELDHATGGPFQLAEIFDLKGSHIGRHTSGTYDFSVSARPRTRKDGDLHSALRVNRNVAQSLVRQLSLDSEFLMRQNIMDYSLLVGVSRGLAVYRDVDPIGESKESDTMRHRGSAPSPHAVDWFSRLSSGEGLPEDASAGPVRYHLGLIDLLQEWTWSKRAERFLKIVFRCHCADHHGLSAIPPRPYAERFVDMVRRILRLPLED